MVNSKAQNPDNTFYRPELDDYNFIPSQGVIPRYFYNSNGFLEGTVPPQMYLRASYEEEENEELQDKNISSGYFIGFIVIVIISLSFYKYWKIKRNYYLSKYSPIKDEEWCG